MREEKASRDEFESLYSEEQLEINIIDYEIECLTTSHFLDVARSKFIETPKGPESWVRSSLDPNRRVLSNKAISDLRSKIMRYRKERNDQFISLITALTGLAGVFVAMLAIYLK